MNCVNHPETPVSAYCQQCGKALCQECVRSVGGVVYCESCLAARLNQPPATPGNPAGRVYVGLPASGAPNPGLALALGFIPGVGAMYNGQFVKGLVHVFVFALLASFSSHESFFGILIPFWIFYQVFDAYQTAKARRDGTPLPNPFGLNDLGYRLGLQQHPEGTVIPPVPPPPYSNPGAPGYSAGGTGVPPGPGFVPPGSVPPGYTPTGYAPTGYSPTGEPSAGWTPYVPPDQAAYGAGFVPGNPPGSTPGSAPPFAPGFVPSTVTIGQNNLPTGAIVLIALGVLFLLGTLGILHDDWIGRSWPLLVVGVGLWLVVRRTRETKVVAPPTSDASVVPPSPAERKSL